MQPQLLGPTSAVMVATTATDAECNGVQYSFEETSGNPGGASSGWQSSSGYTNGGLLPSTLYSFRVRARDASANFNTGNYSAVISVTTSGLCVSATNVSLLNPSFELPTNDDYSAPSNWNYTGQLYRGPWAALHGGLGAYFAAYDTAGTGSLWQSMTSTGGVYTFELFTKAGMGLPVAQMDLRLNWYSACGQLLQVHTQKFGPFVGDYLWHRRFLTATGTPNGIAYVQPTFYASWGTPLTITDIRLDKAACYTGTLRDTSVLLNPGLNSTGQSVFYGSLWDALPTDALGPYSFEVWAERTDNQPTNSGVAFHGWEAGQSKYTSSVSQGVVSRGGSHVFGVWMMREPGFLLSNCQLRIEWRDAVSTNKPCPDTVLPLASIPGDSAWRFYSVTGACASASLLEVRPVVMVEWGGGGSAAMMIDDATLIALTGSADGDEDGLPDAWEWRNFSSLTNIASADSDQDGLRNVDEFVADTQPTNALSVFRTLNYSNTFGVLNLMVDPSSTGRVYDVLWRTNLTSAGPWIPAGLSVTGSGSMVILSVTNAAPMRYYRSGVRLP